MRKGTTVVAGLFAAALLATPIAVGATKALATSDQTGAVTRVAAAPVEAAPVQSAPATVAPCKKVRVVYGGYNDAQAACTAAR